MDAKIYAKVGEEFDAIPFPDPMTEAARKEYHDACLVVFAANGIIEEEWLIELEDRLEI